MKTKAYANTKGTNYIGPNITGIIVPDETSLVMISSSAVVPGDIAIVSRSRTLTDEVAVYLTEEGVGQV